MIHAEAGEAMLEKAKLEYHLRSFLLRALQVLPVFLVEALLEQ